MSGIKCQILHRFATAGRAPVGRRWGAGWPPDVRRETQRERERELRGLKFNSNLSSSVFLSFFYSPFLVPLSQLTCGAVPELFVTCTPSFSADIPQPFISPSIQNPCSITHFSLRSPTPICIPTVPLVCESLQSRISAVFPVD